MIISGYKKFICAVWFLVLFVNTFHKAQAQVATAKADWIRPENGKAPSIWGHRNGIVFGLWPYGIETAAEEKGGGPRGLIRVGYESEGKVYLLNFIAIEPVVNGKIEFSEISPSKVDGNWGKLIWAGNGNNAGGFYPAAITRGTLTQPDPKRPDIEELSVYIYMEQFLNGAHPYLKVTINSNRPEEIGFEIFHQKNSADMERCVLTATMGNYSRLRLLYLKDKVVDSRNLYKGFDGIDFVEKEGYPLTQLLKDKNNDFLAVAASDESFSKLASWPESPGYKNSGWRYRAPLKFTQYWRKDHSQYDASLQVRVNGRAKYWSGGSQNKNEYVPIPGGASFENFEFREKYYPGQKFYYGITRKSPEDLFSK